MTVTRRRLNWGIWKSGVYDCITKLNRCTREANELFERNDLSLSYKTSACSRLVGQLGTYIRRADHKIELAGDRYAPLQVSLASARDRAQATVDELAAACRLLSG